MLFAVFSAAAKAKPPGNKAYFAVTAAFADCVLIMVLATPTAFSATTAAACIALFFSPTCFNKPIPAKALFIFASRIFAFASSTAFSAASSFLRCISSSLNFLSLDSLSFCSCSSLLCSFSSSSLWL